MRHSKVLWFFICLFFVLLLIIVTSNLSKEEWVSIDSNKVSPHYIFLLFPKKDAKMYSSPILKKDDDIGLVVRAISATKKEIDTGVVRAVLNEDVDGFVSLSDLTLIPDFNKYSLHLKQWNDSLVYQGYTKGHFFVEKTHNKDWLMKLELIDSRHVREERYEYKVDKNGIKEVKLIGVRSGILEGLMMFFIFTAFVMYFIYLGFRKFLFFQ